MELISKKSVIRILNEEPSYSDALNVLTELEDKVNALPTIEERKTEWHPYPKEKPSDGFDNVYLVTRGNGENHYVDIGWLDEFGWHESNRDANHIYGVTAWEELPKPYEGSE